MKTLSQIPRKISAKFCYQKAGPSESLEYNNVPNNNKVSKNYEQIATNVKNLVEKSDPNDNILTQKEIDAAYNDNVKVEINLKDSALANNNDVKLDLAADVPGGLFRKFFTGNPLDNKLMEKVVSLGTITKQEATDRFGFENWAA